MCAKLLPRSLGTSKQKDAHLSLQLTSSPITADTAVTHYRSRRGQCCCRQAARLCLYCSSSRSLLQLVSVSTAARLGHCHSSSRSLLQLVPLSAAARLCLYCSSSRSLPQLVAVSAAARPGLCHSSSRSLLQLVAVSAAARCGLTHRNSMPGSALSSLGYLAEPSRQPRSDPTPHHHFGSNNLRLVPAVQAQAHSPPPESTSRVRLQAQDILMMCKFLLVLSDTKGYLDAVEASPRGEWRQQQR
uniref:Uncharacterized protein n=1 Tax=Knipowitschia caucasica TaxID=637954 RepID=A0AAV2IZ29_KNICA